ncbi:hypothetical protein XBLMG947_3832 [Xanthomonas bromi]|uniref:Uncharacterized protein n=1 Tax=Xanthomonas bromi TaxID=56449 RepID=A0A1C3NRK8_9XANT|nr:hypothetical protein XBLMG947_3832 [Xanthomonas bromi]
MASGGASISTESLSGSWVRRSPSQGSPPRSRPPLPSTTPMPPVALCSSVLPVPKLSGATVDP